MTAGEIIDAIQGHGAALLLEDGKARVRGGRIPEELMTLLKANREAVLAEMRRRADRDLDRYCEVPRDNPVMFGRTLQLPEQMRLAIMHHALRQPRPVHAWVMRRADEYYALGVPVEDCEWRACVDLIAWQRSTDGRKAADWLAGVEESLQHLKKNQQQKEVNECASGHSLDHTKEGSGIPGKPAGRPTECKAGTGQDVGGGHESGPVSPDL
jgi:hypothetical protein